MLVVSSTCSSIVVIVEQGEVAATMVVEAVAF